MTVEGSNLRDLAARALNRIDELEAELRRERSHRDDTVAIVGMSCRVPGGDTLEDFWRLLIEGGDAIGPIPGARWSGAELDSLGATDFEKRCLGSAGLVAAPEAFDPEFFGISPREAETLDPQHRLLLETAWEGLEDAGVTLAEARRAVTGVFIGINSLDYGLEVFGDAHAVPDPFLTTGTSHSVASGRLAYVWGLRGPAVSFDTACSSSMTAVHYARSSLLAGDCDIALAGGVNRLLLPHIGLQFARAKMLSSTGRCRTFDASADGFVRGEGCATVVMKRLTDALADNDRIYACLSSTAINQDGRTSGLTVPNGTAQERVIRRALDAAGLHARDIVYTEAHGTGTRLGDPIELRALGRVHADRTGDPLMVGSVKTNIGHLEAAAGIVGLVKAALTARNGVVPPHLHLRIPTREVDWRELPLAVPTTATPLPSGWRGIGVSSFGFSGTNLHAVLTPGPPVERTATVVREDRIVAVSARTEAALREQVARTSAFLEARPGYEYPTIAATSTRRRTAFEKRLAVVARSAVDAANELRNASLASRREGGVELHFAPARDVRIDQRVGERFTVFTQSVLAGLRIAENPSAGRTDDLSDPVATANTLPPPLRATVGQLAAFDTLTALGLRAVRITGGTPAAACAAGRLSREDCFAMAGGALPSENAQDPSGDAVRQVQLTVVITPEGRWHVGSCDPLGIGDPWRPLLEAIAAAFVAGSDIDWSLVAEPGSSVASLPSYPFQRRDILKRFNRETSGQADVGGEGATCISVVTARLTLEPVASPPSALRLLPAEFSEGLIAQALSEARPLVLEFERWSRTERPVQALLTVARALLSHARPSRVVMVGTVDGTVGEEMLAVATAIAKTLRHEHPEASATVLVVEGASPDSTADAVNLLARSSSGPLVFAREDGLFQESIVAVPEPAIAPLSRLDGCSVIGCDGGLGGAVAAELAGRGIAVEELRFGGQPCGRSVFIVQRPGSRRLIRDWEPVGFAAAFGEQADEMRHAIRALHGDARVTLCRGGEATFGWPGRLLETSVSEFAYLQARRSLGDDASAIDVLGLRAPNGSNDEADRLSRHGISSLSSASAARAIVASRGAAPRIVVGAASVLAKVTMGEPVHALARRFRAARYRDGADADGPTRAGEIVAAILGSRPSDLDWGRPLLDMGLDSLLALEVREEVEAATGMRLSIETMLSGASLSGLIDAALDGSEGGLP